MVHTFSPNSGSETLPADARIGFIAPHPDDIEVMLGHLVRHAIRHLESGGAAIAALVLTAGEDSTKGSEKFVRSGGRKEEARTGLGPQGLGLQDKLIRIGDLPDGQLDRHDPAVMDLITRFATKLGLSHVVTLGPDGGDNHPDHRASHMATMRAVGNTVTVLALNAHGAGSHEVSGDPATKLAAVAHHASQWPLVAIGPGKTTPEGWEEVSGFAIPPSHRDDFAHYRRYLYSETYDVHTSQ